MGKWQQMAKNNEMLVLFSMERQKRPVTSIEIAEDVDLPKSTVLDVLDRLILHGNIEKFRAKKSSGPGKSKTFFRLIKI